jgi:hypothetical protein
MMEQLRTDDTKPDIADYNKAACPRFDVLRDKRMFHPLDEFSAIRIMKAHQHNTRMGAGFESSDIRKIQILCD